MRPPVLKDLYISVELNLTPLRLPVLREHIFMANHVVFQDGFYCTYKLNSILKAMTIHNYIWSHVLSLLRFNIQEYHKQVKTDANHFQMC